MNYLGLCCVIKDEDEDYIREWINYHLQIGVEKIILYDNGSSLPVRQMVAAEEFYQQVEVVDAPGQAIQLVAYLHCLHTYGNSLRWLGFIDLDEFIYPKETEDLRVFLQEFEAYAALGIHWQVFGSSGHDEKPDSSQIMSFTWRTPVDADMNHLIKCMVNPAQTLFPVNPHYFIFADDQICVNEKHQHMPDCYIKKNDVVVNRIQINHYFCRSRAEYQKKIARGRADIIQTTNNPRLWKDFEDTNANSMEEDYGLFRLWERLQKKSSKASMQKSENKPCELTRQLIQSSTRERIRMVMDDAMRSKNMDKILLALYVLSKYFPPMFENHLLASETYNLLGYSTTAWEELEKARKQEPSSLEVINHIGRFLYAHKELKEAEKAFGTVLQQDTHNEEALISLGKILHETGRLQEALRLLKFAYQVYPANRDIQAGLLVIQKTMGLE